MFLLVVDAGESLAVEDAVVPAVVDPGVTVHTHDVGGLVSGLGEPDKHWFMMVHLKQFKEAQTCRITLSAIKN